jgi:hypothetical protein
MAHLIHTQGYAVGYTAPMAEREGNTSRDNLIGKGRAMRRVRTLILAVFVVVGAMSPAFAAHGEYYDYVRAVHTGDNSIVSITVPGNFSSDHGCSQPWWARSKFPVSDARTKAQMTIAMSSLLTRKKVYVVTDGCTPDGYPIFTQLLIEVE